LYDAGVTRADDDTPLARAIRSGTRDDLMWDLFDAMAAVGEADDDGYVRARHTSALRRTQAARRADRRAALEKRLADPPDV